MHLCTAVSFFLSMSRSKRFRKRRKIIVRKVSEDKKFASKNARSYVAIDYFAVR